MCDDIIEHTKHDEISSVLKNISAILAGCLTANNYPDEYIEELITSDVFLSCSRSEGWNLPLIESLACGTPSIYTKCSGQLEFTKSKGLGVEILGEEPATNNENLSYEHNIPGNFYTPDFNSLVNRIKDVYSNYSVWKKWHLQYSKELREEFSWKNQARTVLLAHGLMNW